MTKRDQDSLFSSESPSPFHVHRHEWIVQALNNGWTIVPLAHGTKRPLIRWKPYKNRFPGFYTTTRWFGYFYNAEIGLITSDESGVICLDCDAPPYPESGVYTKTPSGGRHYWYHKHPDDHHGIGVAPGKDIPWIVKLYDFPQINPGRIPLNAQPSVPSTQNDIRIDETIPYEAYWKCEFMKWYQDIKLTAFDGRYGMARAFASNIQNSDAPWDVRELGQNYQHEEHIYKTVGRPATCAHICEHFYRCRFYNKKLDCCNKDHKSRSPYGLAANLSRNPHEDNDT